MVELQQLTKRYGDLCAPPSRKLAVDGISATIRPGVVTGFLGPNRAGSPRRCGWSGAWTGPLPEPRWSTADRTSTRPPHWLRSARCSTPGPSRAASARNHLLALGPTVGNGPQRVDDVLASVGLTEVAHKSAGSFSLGWASAWHRRGAAGRPGRPDLRRARQRPRPRRHPVVAITALATIGP
jgi:ABC-2 type transport system ATP-binding protein